MKKISFILLTLFINFNLNAQNPYYDALILKEFSTIDRDPESELIILKLDSNNIQEISSMFINYGLEGDSLTGKEYSDKIDSLLRDNPFISIASTVQSFGLAGKIQAEPKSFIDDIAGLDVTNIARGISLFMIDRAKKELNAAFFDRLKKQFEKNPEIQILFPKTSSSLEQLLSYHYSEMLPALRTNFFEDLKKISTRLDDLLELPRYQVLLENLPELKVAIRSIQLMHNIENEKIHPAELIELFADFEEWKEESITGKYGFKNFGSTLRLGALISNSLRYVNQPENYMTERDTTIQLYKGTINLNNETYIIYSKLDKVRIYEEKKKNEYLIVDEVLPLIYKPKDREKPMDLEKIGFKSEGSTEDFQLVNIDLNQLKIKTKKIIIRKIHYNLSNKITKKTITFSDEKANLLLKEEYQAIEALSSKGSRAWIDSKELLELVGNETTFKIYMGLLYQQIKSNEIKFNIKGTQPEGLETLIANNENTIFKYQNFLSEFIQNAEKVDNKIAELKKARADTAKISNEDLFNYIENSIAIIEYGFEVFKLFDKEIDIDIYLKIARNGNDLYKNVFQENYTAGITNLIAVIESIADISNKEFQEKFKNQQNEIREFYNEEINKKILDKKGYAKSISYVTNYNIRESPYKDNNKEKQKHSSSKIKSQIVIIEKDCTDLGEKILKLSSEQTESYQEKINCLNDTIKSLILLRSKYENLIKDDTTLNFSIKRLSSRLEIIRKYGLFAANIVEAKDAEEVQGVIESAALPVGSSALKKHSKVNVSVQSFLGVGLAYSKENLDRSWDNNVVVFAPIGVSVDYGFGKGGSLGLFVSLLDVGAIVDYELRSDTTFAVIDNNVDTTRSVSVSNSQNYKVELGQIISPGFFVTYGFPFNTPMAINVGAQYGPGLIEIKDDNTVLGKPNWRFIASLTIDIPWFTLYNVDNPKYRKNLKNGKK